MMENEFTVAAETVQAAAQQVANERGESVDVFDVAGEFVVKVGTRTVVDAEVGDGEVRFTPSERDVEDVLDTPAVFWASPKVEVSGSDGGGVVGVTAGDLLDGA